MSISASERGIGVGVLFPPSSFKLSQLQSTPEYTLTGGQDVCKGHSKKTVFAELTQRVSRDSGKPVVKLILSCIPG